MLLNDSVELEYNDYSASAEPLPLNWDIELSHIWIPSSLLPNRKKSINPNENKPFIFHTLEKPDESNGFSVYSDGHSQYHESPTSSAVSPQKLRNDGDNEFQIQQVLTASQNAFESDTKLGISNKEGISPLQPLNRYKQDDSLRETQEIHNLPAKNAVLWDKNTTDICSIQDTNIKASVEDLVCRMAEILSEEPLETDWIHKDVMEANQVTTSSTFDSIPPSTKDSLEDIYYSDEDEDQFDVEEYELVNRESEFSEKKYTSSIYTDNSYVHEQPSESVLNNCTDLERAKNNIIKTVCQSFKDTTKIPVDNVFNQAELEEPSNIHNIVYSNDSEQELQKFEGESSDHTEKVIEFPIAYIRPPLQETNKTKPKKEKKKTKKSKINMPLEDLFQSKEVDRFKVPEVDEFYDNLVRQGKCPPRNQETDIEEFPSVNFSNKLQSNVQEFPSLNFSGEPQTSLFWDSAQKFTQSIDGEVMSSSSQEVLQNEEISEPELEPNVSFDTIVIDNIHLDVSKETIESFILGYGEVKRLTIEKHGQFQKAILQMDFNCEVDWIIDCLNDSQPFGSFDKELVKCYRLT